MAEGVYRKYVSPLEVEHGDGGWLPLTEEDRAAWDVMSPADGVISWQASREEDDQEYPAGAKLGYLFVRNREGKYDRWRGAGHGPGEEPR